MTARLQRLSFFQNWLSDWYGVKAPLNGDGILAIEKWADRYAGGLITNVEESSKVFTIYQPNWMGENRGYNVLVDIAIFVGEFLISRRPHLLWTLLTDDKGGLADSEEGMGSTFGRPALGGFCWTIWQKDLFEIAYLKALACRNKFEFGGKQLLRIHVSLASVCRESLHVATHRDPRATFVFGDYSHGPL
jgi:hypothetical protein